MTYQSKALHVNTMCKYVICFIVFLMFAVIYILYDWLDTMKKNGGTIFFRFLLPDGVVVRPKATVVKFHEIHMYEQNI